LMLYFEFVFVANKLYDIKDLLFQGIEY